jgi:hypothetical protein
VAIVVGPALGAMVALGDAHAADPRLDEALAALQAKDAVDNP